MATPPFAFRVTRVTIAGSCYNGQEEWSTGFYLGNETADADLPNQQLVDDVSAAWHTFFTNSGSHVSSSYRTTLVKASSMGTDGKSNAEDTFYNQWTTTVTGAQPLTMPPQVALVATLVSAKARGVGAKGRMYLPGICTVVDGNGRISDTPRNTILTNIKTFLTAVNASTSTNNVIMLASHGSINRDGTPKVGGSAPINKAVTTVRVGNVYDTQRRRRNGFAENYASQTIS